MSIPGLYGSALSGLALQADRLAASAHNTANATTDEFVPQQVDAVEIPGRGVRGVLSSAEPARTPPPLEGAEEGLPRSGTDIATEQVIQMEATAAFKANAAVVRTGEELDRTLLDIVG